MVLGLLVPTGEIVSGRSSQAAIPPLGAAARVDPSGATPGSFAPAVSPGWTLLNPSASPTARSNGSLAYDPIDGYAVLFGGWNGSYLGDTWSFRDGGWTQLPVTNHPSARSGAVLVYDPARSSLVLFGGTNGAPLGDSWAFRGGLWTKLNLHPAPAARAGAAAAYDPTSGGVVLFGGIGTKRFSDTWLLTTQGWATIRTPLAPVARAYATLAFDGADGYLVLFGGSGGTVLSNTWAFSNGAWTKLTPTDAPSARWLAGAAFDEADGFVLLFGGLYAKNLASTYAFKSGDWSLMAPSPAPSGRSGLAMTFDAADGFVLLFGGHGTGWLGDTWAFKVRATIAGWEQLPIANGPRSRQQGVTAYDPIDGVTVLFGGWKSTETDPQRAFLNDTWAFRAGVWTLLHPAVSPPPRRGAMMAFDPIDGYLVMFGGSNATAYLNDTWTFRGGTWSPLPLAVAPPTGRSGAMTFDAADGYVLLFGGHNGSGVLVNSTARYFLQADTWSFRGGRWMELQPARHPSARSEANMAYDATDGYVVLFGGYSYPSRGWGEVEQNDTWRFLGGQWTNLTASLGSSIVVRDGQPLVFDPTTGYVLMFGGDTGDGAPIDLWAYRAGWSLLCQACMPAYRSGSHATYDAADGYVVYLGGTPGGSTATYAWVPIPLAMPMAPNVTVRVGVPVTLSAHVSGAVLPLQYAWNLGDGNRSTASTPFERFPTAGIYVVRCTVTDATGIFANLSLLVSVLGPLSLDAHATPNATDVGYPVAFHATATGGAAPYAFSWRFGDGAGASVGNAVHAYGSVGTFLAIASVRDANGTARSIVIDVVVTTVPTVAVTPSVSRGDAGRPIGFTAVTGGGTAPFRWVWAYGDGKAGDGSPAYHTYAAAGTYNVTVTLTDAAGAAASAGSVATVRPALLASAWIPTVGDVGRPVGFSGNATGGWPSYVFRWFLGDNTSVYLQNPSHTYDAPGTYAVQFRVHDAISVGSFVFGNITIGAALSGAIVGAPNGTQPAGQNFSLSASVSGGTGPFAIRWDFGDGSNASGWNCSHAYTLPGRYTVSLEVVDAVGSRSVTTLRVIVT